MQYGIVPANPNALNFPLMKGGILLYSNVFALQFSLLPNPSKSMIVRFLALHIVSGIVPVRQLVAADKPFKLGISRNDAGIDPVNKLLATFTTCNDTESVALKNLKISPENRLSFNNSSVNVDNFPRDDGRVPEK